MPANLAIALHPEFEYVLVAVEKEDGTSDLLLVATELARATFEEIGIELAEALYARGFLPPGVDPAFWRGGARRSTGCRPGSPTA